MLSCLSCDVLFDGNFCTDNAGGIRGREGINKTVQQVWSEFSGMAAIDEDQWRCLLPVPFRPISDSPDHDIAWQEPLIHADLKIGGVLIGSDKRFPPAMAVEVDR